MSESYKSVYRMGAEDGLILGPLLAAAAICMGASIYYPLLFFPTVIALVAVPAAVYWFLARAYRSQPELSTFSALWLQGICSFFFGSLIMGLLVYGALRFFAPNFIYDQAEMVIEAYGSSPSPELGELVKGIERARDHHMLPSSADMTLELMYTVVFTGSILSMFLSLIVRAAGSRKRFHKPPTVK